MVSARKTKARLDNKKIEELKNKNVEKQKELSLSVDDARALSDELVKSAISGFERELSKSSPAVKQLATNLSDLLKEFFIGFKQGIDAELNTFVKDTSKTLSKVTDKLVEEVSSNSKNKEESLKTQIEPLKEKSDINLAIADVLARKDEEGAASKTVLGKTGNVKDWLTRAGLGSIGMEDYAEKVVAERQKKEAFIKTETKLRADEFQGMDPKEIRAKLEEDFKTISETTKKLKDIEEEISAYKELGYSEEQIKKLGVGKGKEELAKTLIAADPSRLGKYKETETPPNQVPDQHLSTQSPLKTVPSPVTEEVAMEQAVMDEEAAKQREKQTTLLSEIRDILKSPKSQTTTTISGESGPSLPDINLPGRSRGGILKTAGRAALNVAKKAAPWAIAGSIMLGGINAVDTGLGKLGVGKDKDGNDLAIDETQDSANWEKMSTGGKIMSGTARGIEKVGSFLGLDSLTRAARADRIKSETDYLKGKETTIQDVKTATTEMQQNKVESQSSKKEAGPNWTKQRDYYNKNPNSTPVSHLDKQFPGISKEFVNLAMTSVPRSDSRMSIETHEEVLKAKAMAKLSGGTNKKEPVPMEKTTGSIEEQPTQQTNAKEYMIDSRQIPVPIEKISSEQKSPSAKVGFFSNLGNKVKNFFGMGTPTVETNGTEKISSPTQPVKEAGPNWTKQRDYYNKNPNSTPVSHLENQYPGISKEFVNLAMTSVPKTDNLQSVETHEQLLIQKAIAKLSGGTNKKEPVPMEKTVSGAPRAPETAWQPADVTKLQVEAKKQGISGKVKGIFEGGVLTGITDEAGKNYPVEVKEADKRNVELARTMRTANERSANLQQAVIDNESTQPRKASSTLKETPVDTAAINAAAEMGKNITVQSPPVVIPQGAGGGQQVVSQPFTNNIRNNEPSISDYLRSKYAY